MYMGKACLCTALTSAGLECVPSLSKTHMKKVTDSCLTALSTIKHKTVFMSHFHQLMETCVMFFIIVAIDNDIIYNSNHVIKVVKDLVHYGLEGVFYTGQVTGETNKMVSSQWSVESCQQG